MRETWNTLEAAARNDRLVILCGAGVSRPDPAGLPTVDELVRGLLGGIVDGIPDLRSALVSASHLFLTAPFEVFIAVLEQALLFRTMETLEPITRGAPNAMHRCIANLMVSGNTRAVITTNFDNLIERALGRYRAWVPAAYGWEDAANCLAKPTATKLLKVHGSFVDMCGDDISARTIRTTVDGIYRSSRLPPLIAASRELHNATVLVVGYSGRDRLDVMPFLRLLRGSEVIWVHHTDAAEPTVGSLGGSTPTHLKRLSLGGVNLSEVVGSTQDILETLARRLAVPSLDSANDEILRSVPISFRRGFLPPIVPKYAGLMGGYLLLWAGTSPEAANYALARFLVDHGDDERRAACNALLALGHATSNRPYANDAEQLLTTAVRGFWGLGDYHGVTRGHYLFASCMLRNGRHSQALDMVARGREIAEKEADSIGVGFLEFIAGKILEGIGRKAEAHSRYETALAAGEENGHLWLEAGALQGLVRTAATGSAPSHIEIKRLLRSLELVHWTSGGSAPAPWMVEMVDSFWATDRLGRALACVEGRNAISIIESNHFLADVGLDTPIRERLARYG